jgi:hypothetical protein
LQIRLYEPRDKAAIIKMATAQFRAWAKREPKDEEILIPDDALVELAMVVEDDDGKVLAAFAAKRTVEIIATMDPDKPSLDRFYRWLLLCWAKMVAKLYLVGYEDCHARIGKHLTRWGNTVVKRAGWQRAVDPVYRFDIKKACSPPSAGNTQASA